jgi:hypothetical protein
MSVSTGTTGIIDDGRDLLSSTFLEFCAKVRNNDPSILPAVDEPFKIRRMCEREHIELVNALLENNSVTYLQLEMENYSKSSAEAMAKYVLTSKRLQRIRWNADRDTELQQREEMLCCFLPAIQESTSLKELHITFPVTGGPSNLALENILTHTQSLQSPSLRCLDGLLQYETGRDVPRGVSQSHNPLSRLHRRRTSKKCQQSSTPRSHQTLYHTKFIVLYFSSSITSSLLCD